MSESVLDVAQKAVAPDEGRPPRAGRVSVLAATVGTAALNLSTTAVNFVVVLVLGRALGADGYGAYAYATAWAIFLSVPASLGLTPLVIRHVASYVAHGRWGLVRGLVLRTHQVVLASSVLLVGGGALVGWQLHSGDDQLRTPFLIGLLLVPLMSLTSLRQAVLKGLNRVILGRVPETLVVPGLFLALAAAAWAALGDRFDAEWAVGLYVVAVLVGFVVGTVILRLVTPREVRSATAEDEVRAWIRSGLPLMAIGLLLVVQSQIGTILLGSMDSAKAAGIFTAATKVAMFTSFLYLAATYPLYPTVARLWATGEKAELQRVLTRTIRLVLLGSVVVAVVFLVFGAPILRVLNTDFEGGVTALRILTVGELLKVLAGFGGLALVMTPFEGSMARAMAVGVAVNVPLTAALIPVWGASGAALGTSVSVLLSSAYIAWLAWRDLGVYSPALGPVGRLAGRTAAR